MGASLHREKSYGEYRVIQEPYPNINIVRCVKLQWYYYWLRIYEEAINQQEHE